MPGLDFPCLRVSTRLVRRVVLIGVAALPFACSVYGPSDLRGPEQGQAGIAGALSGRANASAGDAGKGGTTSAAGVSAGGVNPAAGTASEGGSIGGGAPGKAGSSAGGSVPAGQGGAAGEGGAGAEGGGSAGGAAGAGGAGGSDTGGMPAIPGLVASYPCESASGAVLADASGSGKDATLANASGGSPVGFSFGSGVVGKALTLSASDRAFVSLMHGIVSQLPEVTIATWVKLKTGAAFQRIFDFSVDTNTFMYLTNAGNSGFVRFRISSTSLNKNQALEGTKALPVGTWTHVAVSIGNNGVSIYVDGAQIAQQAPAVLKASDLGDTGNNFIGRSPFPDDPYLDGQIDEFRIYNRVLSLAEIGTLAKAP